MPPEGGIPLCVCDHLAGSSPVGREEWLEFGETSLTKFVTFD